MSRPQSECLFLFLSSEENPGVTSRAEAARILAERWAGEIFDV
jgi:hypothetical protein